MKLDPTQHGEINGIQRCTRILAEKGLSPAQILGAMKQLSLYTVTVPEMYRLTATFRTLSRVPCVLLQFARLGLGNIFMGPRLTISSTPGGDKF